MKKPSGRRPIQRLRLEVLHFFDTNFLLLPEANLPALKHVPGRPRWLTETVREEAIEKLGNTAAESIDASYETLRFNDLYRIDPGICPTYYEYIVSMYNPANIGMEGFAEEMYNSRIIKHAPISAEDRKEYEAVRRQSSTGHAHDHLGQPKDESWKRLDRLDSRLRKKASASMRDGHPAYLRDIKSLALALYNCLSTRKNTIFYTTDGDPTVLFLKWLDSMTMHMMLGWMVLPKLGKLDRHHLAQGGKVDVVLDAEEFVTRRIKLFEGFVLSRQMTEGCCFTVKQWNQVDQRFEEDVYLWFEDNVASGLTRMHGNLACYFTKNAEQGNWLNLRYHWPPTELDAGKIRVNLAQKRIVNEASSTVPTEEHDRSCRFRQEDASGKIAEWSQFVVPGASRRG